MTENEDGTKTADVTINYGYDKREVNASGIPYMLLWKAYYGGKAGEASSLEPEEALRELYNEKIEESPAAALESIKETAGESVNFVINMAEDATMKKAYIGAMPEMLEYVLEIMKTTGPVLVSEESRSIIEFKNGSWIVTD